jgi:SP family myo-inositol transporter-like MFS transporter 13
VEREIEELKESVEAEVRERGSSEKVSLATLLRTATVRRGLVAGVGLQVFQQLVGINTVMYYSPTIVQLAGFASNQTALALSLVTSGLNALGSIVSIYFIDRTGRKKLLVISLVGVILSLGVLTAVFHETTSHSPAVSAAAISHFDGSLTCPDYKSSATASGGRSFWDCTRCLVSNTTVRDACHSDGEKKNVKGYVM